MAVLGKNIGEGAGPSSFGRQQQLSEITIEPKIGVFFWGGGLGKTCEKSRDGIFYLAIPM